MTSQKKVLIVDDDSAIRELYAYMFSDNGYIVETACDGAQALHMAEAAPPDCILMDISMPEMSGEELAARLQRSPQDRLREIPFIVLTGGSPSDCALHPSFYGNASCKGLLHKMAAPDNVLQAVAGIFRR